MDKRLALILEIVAIIIFCAFGIWFFIWSPIVETPLVFHSLLSKGKIAAIAASSEIVVMMIKIFVGIIIVMLSVLGCIVIPLRKRKQEKQALIDKERAAETLRRMEKEIQKVNGNKEAPEWRW